MTRDTPRKRSSMRAGPSFKSKTIKEFVNVDIAPTVAYLIGIDPPADAQGKKLSNAAK